MLFDIYYRGRTLFDANRSAISSEGDIDLSSSTVSGNERTTVFDRVPGSRAGSISLYIPSGITTEYGLNYEESELGTLGSIINYAAQGSTTGVAGGMFQAGIEMATGRAGEAIKNKINRDYLGVVRNPHMELFFKSPSFRTHQFVFRFFPRNQKEAQNVRDIVYRFKYHAHPDIDPSTERAVFIYPDEFEIAFLDTTSGSKMFKIGRSYCTSVSVNYTGQGPVFFDATGDPAIIEMSLTFKEAALLTKTEIENGY